MRNSKEGGQVSKADGQGGMVFESEGQRASKHKSGSSPLDSHVFPAPLATLLAARLGACIAQTIVFSRGYKNLS